MFGALPECLCHVRAVDNPSSWSVRWNPLSVEVNAMAGKTSKKSTKVAKMAAIKRVAAKASKPRKTAPKSQSRKVAKQSNGTRRCTESRAGLVPRHPLLHELRQSGFLPRGEASQPIARRTNVTAGERRQP